MSNTTADLIETHISWVLLSSTLNHTVEKAVRATLFHR